MYSMSARSRTNLRSRANDTKTSPTTQSNVATRSKVAPTRTIITRNKTAINPVINSKQSDAQVSIIKSATNMRSYSDLTLSKPRVNSPKSREAIVIKIANQLSPPPAIDFEPSRQRMTRSRARQQLESNAYFSESTKALIKLAKGVQSKNKFKGRSISQDKKQMSSGKAQKGQMQKSRTPHVQSPKSQTANVKSPKSQMANVKSPKPQTPHVTRAPTTRSKVVNQEPVKRSKRNTQAQSPLRKPVAEVYTKKLQINIPHNKPSPNSNPASVQKDCNIPLTFYSLPKQLDVPLTLQGINHSKDPKDDAIASTPNSSTNTAIYTGNRPPIYKTRVTNSQSSVEQSGQTENVYDYNSNSQEQDTHEKDESMLKVFKKLQREKKIVLKRKPTKRLQNPKKPTVHQQPTYQLEKRRNITRAGLKTLKNMLKMPLPTTTASGNPTKSSKCVPIVESSARNHNAGGNDGLTTIDKKTGRGRMALNPFDSLLNGIAISDKLKRTHKSKNSPTDNNFVVNDLKEFDDDHFDHASYDLTDPLGLKQLQSKQNRSPDSKIPKRIDLSKSVRKTYKGSPRRQLLANKNLSIDRPTFQSTPVRDLLVKGGGDNSPWRVDSYHLPSTVYFNTSRNHLPTYSSDYIGAKDSIANKSKALIPFNLSPAPPPISQFGSENQVHETVSGAETRSATGKRLSFGQNDRDLSEDESETEANHSNMENIEPDDYEEMRDIAHGTMKIIRMRKQNGTRSPLKSLAIRNILHAKQLTLPEKRSDSSNTIYDSSANHRPPPTDTISHSVQDFFGFTSDDDDDDTEHAVLQLEQQQQKHKEQPSTSSSSSARAKPNVSEVPSPSTYRKGRNNLKEKLLQLKKRIQPPKQRPSGPTRLLVPVKKAIATAPKRNVFANVPVKDTVQKTIEETMSGGDFGRTMDNDEMNMSNISIIEEPEDHHWSPVLFKSWIDGEENDESTIKTYTRNKRKRHISTSYSDAEDDDEEGKKQKKGHKIKVTKRKKDEMVREKDFEEFANHFNSMCEEVEHFELVLEKSS